MNLRRSVLAYKNFAANPNISHIGLHIRDWEWIDWTRSVITVPAKVTKNKKPRIIPVYADMVEFLKAA
jgi:hypothetical protein